MIQQAITVRKVERKKGEYSNKTKQILELKGKHPSYRTHNTIHRDAFCVNYRKFLTKGAALIQRKQVRTNSIYSGLFFVHLSKAKNELTNKCYSMVLQLAVNKICTTIQITCFTYKTLTFIAINTEWTFSVTTEISYLVVVQFVLFLNILNFKYVWNDSDCSFYCFLLFRFYFGIFCHLNLCVIYVNENALYP